MIEVVIDTRTVKRLVVEFLRSKLGDLRIDEANVLFEVKTKQNYRAEWEQGEFKAIFRKHDLL